MPAPELRHRNSLATSAAPLMSQDFFGKPTWHQESRIWCCRAMYLQLYNKWCRV